MQVPGNKMDSHNLATLFGPNVLHRARAVNEKQFMAECAEQAEQSSEVISVVKDMIDNYYDLFEVGGFELKMETCDDDNGGGAGYDEDEADEVVGTED